MIPGIGGLLSYLIPFVIVLTAVVFIHEGGHFLVGRWCGVKVDVFSIGFGPEIFGWNDRQGTRWKVCWVPLGGYVKFYGDQSEASTPDQGALETMSVENRKVSFHHQKLWKRASIVAAGPMANFILSTLIYAGLLMWNGQYVSPPRVDIVEAGSAAETAGFMPGDLITRQNGAAITSMDDVFKSAMRTSSDPIDFVVERDGRQLALNLVPEMVKYDGPGGGAMIPELGIKQTTPARIDELAPDLPAERAGFQVDDEILSIDGLEISGFGELVKIIKESDGSAMTFGILRDGQILTLSAAPERVDAPTKDDPDAFKFLIGITHKIENDPDLLYIRHNPFSALIGGVKETYYVLGSTVAYISRIFRGTESADQLRGPIGIAEITGDVAHEYGWYNLIRLTALISASIGFINLFPIPILDGGHLLFYAYEAVRGKPLGERAQEYGFKLGLVLMLSLMIFTTMNDLLRNSAFDFFTGIFS